MPIKQQKHLQQTETYDHTTLFCSLNNTTYEQPSMFCIEKRILSFAQAMQALFSTFYHLHKLCKRCFPRFIICISYASATLFVLSFAQAMQAPHCSFCDLHRLCKHSHSSFFTLFWEKMSKCDSHCDLKMSCMMVGRAILLLQDHLQK